MAGLLHLGLKGLLGYWIATEEQTLADTFCIIQTKEV